jgi:hypothetical protein
VDVIFKNDQGNWCLSSPEEQSIRMLAPSDSSGCICSFKGVIYYPFKFKKDEPSTVMYKFTEEPIKIAAPRKLITIAYTGRIDVFNCYIKDIPEYKDEDPKKPAAGFSSAFGQMSGSEKIAFFEEKKETKTIPKSKIENWDKKDDSKLLGSKLVEMTLGDKKSVSFNESNNEEDTAVRTPVREVKSILKKNESPLKNYDARKDKEELEKKNMEKLSKREAVSAQVMRSPKATPENAEEALLKLEQQENEFLESIEDEFAKLFLKTQYSLANDINRSFISLNESKTEADSFLSTKSNDTRILRDRLVAYVLGSNKLQREFAKLTDATKENTELTEKIQNYWSSVKDSDSNAGQQISNRIGENDLFSRKIEDIILRGEETLNNSFKFVHIIRSLTKQAKKLNESF